MFLATLTQIRWKFLLIIQIVSVQIATAQFATVTFAKTKYADTAISDEPGKPKNHFPLKSFTVAGCLISYGIIANRSDITLDLNEYFKRKIWTDNPHLLTNADTYLQFAPAVMAYGLSAAGLKAKDNLLNMSMLYLLSNIIMNSAVTVAKDLTHELRPDGSDYHSFPSGHTAEAFASAEFLFLEYKDQSVWWGISGYCIAASVAYLRLYNDKHWFHDVVAGAGFGIASTKLSFWLYPKIKRLFAPHRELHTMIAPFYDGRSLGLSMVHVL